MDSNDYSDFTDLLVRSLFFLDMGFLQLTSRIGNCGVSGVWLRFITGGDIYSFSHIFLRDMELSKLDRVFSKSS